MHDRLKEAFDKVRAEEELKIHTRAFLAEKRTESGKSGRLTPYRRLMAAAACLVILLFGGSGYYMYFQQVFAISVDINPSVELGINRMNKVISVEAYNDDGDTLLSSLDIRFLDYREALGQILEDRKIQSYLSQDEAVSVTVYSKNEKKSQEMLDSVTACTSSYLNVHCSCASSEEVNAAHASGMSFGKYRAFLELQALDPDLTPEEIQGLSMCQIWDRINVLSYGGGNRQQGIHEHGHSHGHGRGYNEGYEEDFDGGSDCEHGN